jgi:hypothetical protein
VAQRFFRDGWTLEQAAQEQGVAPAGPAFNRLVAEMAERLGEEATTAD